jgi:membrane associated rhomboid family serine protease
MSVCPKCNRRLVRAKTEQGFFFRCPGCDGRAVGLAVLRRAIPRGYVNRLWAKARERGGHRGQSCPICSRPMVEIPVPVGKQEVPLDVCAGCQFVWFDPQEFEQLPVQRPKPKKDPRGRLPEKVREAMAMADLKVDQARQRGGDFGAEPPDWSWKTIPALFGMPVEHEVNSVRCWPWVTWGLAAVMGLTYLATFANLEQVIGEFGLVPAEPWRHGGLTFVTSFFLHGGLLHLIGNAYFLLVFGDNVEDHLGRWRYGLLVLLAALVGDLLHILGDPRDVIPCVGASGGISGVIVFYALKFPRARLGFMFRYWFYFRWIHVPAWFALIGWLLLQALLTYSQLAGVSNVSALAHLGGAGVGLIAWVLWREDRDARRDDTFSSLRRDPGRGP